MTSFLDRVRQKMAGVTAPITKRFTKTRHAVVTNRFDDRVWTEARRADVVDRLITDLDLGDQHRGGTRAPFDSAPELVHDLFMSMYKTSPQLVEQRTIVADCYPNYKILQELLENERLQDLHESTAADPVMSAIALEAMGDVVRDILTRLPPPPPPPAPKGGGGEKQEGGSGEQEPGDGEPGDGAAGGEGQPGEGGPDGADGEGAGETEQEAAEREWQADYDQLIEDVDLDRAIMQALDAANDQTSELEATRKSIGLEDGEWQTMSPEQRLRLAEQFRTPEMRMLAKIVGRMKRYALGVKATRVINVPHEVFDIETGHDLTRTLPSQFAYLSTKETSYEFYRRFAQGQLLQFKKRGTEEVGKGPIVILIDKSTSMKGSPFHWAMGVAESLRRFAMEEDRDYYAIFFGTNADRHRFNFPKGRGPFEKVMAFLSADANGGTAFDGVLTEGLELASTAFDDEARGKADIVFVTDGEAKLSDSWIDRFNAERTRVGVRVYSVYIGGAKDMARQEGPLALLQRISDLTIPVNDLKPEAARNIFAQV